MATRWELFASRARHLCPHRAVAVAVPALGGRTPARLSLEQRGPRRRLALSARGRGRRRGRRGCGAGLRGSRARVLFGSTSSSRAPLPHVPRGQPTTTWWRSWCSSWWRSSSGCWSREPLEERDRAERESGGQAPDTSPPSCCPASRSPACSTISPALARAVRPGRAPRSRPARGRADRGVAERVRRRPRTARPGSCRSSIGEVPFGTLARGPPGRGRRVPGEERRAAARRRRSQVAIALERARLDLRVRGALLDVGAQPAARGAVLLASPTISARRSHPSRPA